MTGALGLPVLDGLFLDGDDDDPPPELGDRIRLTIVADGLIRAHRRTHYQCPTSVITVQEPGKPIASREDPVPPRKRQVRNRLLVAAAVVAVVTAAGGTYVAVDSRESGRAAAEQQLVRELEQPRSRISTLTTPSGEPVGYLVASGATVEFIADGLLPSPAGTKYWAWASSTRAVRPWRARWPVSTRATSARSFTGSRLRWPWSRPRRRSLSVWSRVRPLRPGPHRLWPLESARSRSSKRLVFHQRGPASGTRSDFIVRK